MHGEVTVLYHDLDHKGLQGVGGVYPSLRQVLQACGMLHHPREDHQIYLGKAACNCE